MKILALVIALAVAAPATASARPVSLSQANYAPDWMVLVQGDSAATPAVDRKGQPRICKTITGRSGYFADINAYQWYGSALDSQHVNRRNGFLYWRDRQGGGRVTFDGFTFRNHTTEPVLVAGWCDYGD
jgi:hypothetical protein